MCIKFLLFSRGFKVLKGLFEKVWLINNIVDVKYWLIYIVIVFLKEMRGILCLFWFDLIKLLLILFCFLIFRKSKILYKVF